MENIQFFEKFDESEFMVNIRIPEVLRSDVTVVLIHGFWSIPQGRKYEMLSSVCESLGVKCAVYELIGHGSDIKHLDNMDLNVLAGQLEFLIHKTFNDNVVLVGSCGGGLVALLAAKKCPDAVKGIITLATSLDENLLTPEQKKTVYEEGFVYVRFGRHLEKCKITRKFCISFTLMEHWTWIGIPFPLHILQGSGDDVYDWHQALKLLDAVKGKDVVLKVIQGTSHRMADRKSFREIGYSLQAIIG